MNTLSASSRVDLEVDRIDHWIVQSMTRTPWVIEASIVMVFDAKRWVKICRRSSRGRVVNICVGWFELLEGLRELRFKI